MTQEALSKRAAVSREALMHWERDRCNPQRELLFRVATVLEVSLEYLLYGHQKALKRA